MADSPGGKKDPDEDGPFIDIEVPDLDFASVEMAAKQFSETLNTIAAAADVSTLRTTEALTLAAQATSFANIPRIRYVNRRAGTSEPPRAAIASAEAPKTVEVTTSPAVVIPEAGQPSNLPPAAVFDFSTETGRTDAIGNYTRHWNCSEAALARTAKVDAADLARWKKGTLQPATSAKKTPIENALKNNTPPTPTAQQRLRQRS